MRNTLLTLAYQYIFVVLLKGSGMTSSEAVAIAAFFYSEWHLLSEVKYIETFFHDHRTSFF